MEDFNEFSLEMTDFCGRMRNPQDNPIDSTALLLLAEWFVLIHRYFSTQMHRWYKEKLQNLRRKIKEISKEAKEGLLM